MAPFWSSSIRSDWTHRSLACFGWLPDPPIRFDLCTRSKPPVRKCSAVCLRSEFKRFPFVWVPEHRLTLHPFQVTDERDHLHFKRKVQMKQWIDSTAFFFWKSFLNTYTALVIWTFIVWEIDCRFKCYLRFFTFRVNRSYFDSKMSERVSSNCGRYSRLISGFSKHRSVIEERVYLVQIVFDSESTRSTWSVLSVYICFEIQKTNLVLFIPLTARPLSRPATVTRSSIRPPICWSTISTTSTPSKRRKP